MEEQILRYYIKAFSFYIIIILIGLIFYSTYAINKKHYFSKNIINISKGSSVSKVIKKNFTNINNFDEIIFKLYFSFHSFNKKKIIHYGNFQLGKNISFIKFINIISQPSNILNKITIIDGWSKTDLNNALSKYFTNFKTIEYEDILADTYYFKRDEGFDIFYDKLNNFKKNYLKNKPNDIKLEDIEIMTIGSLIDKEGFDNIDKRKIASVIFNRLNKNMRLQIDASVIFAITDGKYDLNRNLTLKDLKFKHPYNTYKIDGLPPKPISYVSTKTIDIIFDKNDTDYLFYFFNKSLKRHIFSKNFEEHKKKLNEYRNK